MRELTSAEMQIISGAGVFETIAAAFIGAVAGGTEFSIKWAASGGSSGGIIGAGIISAGVGLVVGAVAGVINGALYGIINGWDVTVEWFNLIVENNLNPDANVIKA